MTMAAHREPLRRIGVARSQWSNSQIIAIARVRKRAPDPRVAPSFFCRRFAQWSAHDRPTLLRLQYLLLPHACRADDRRLAVGPDGTPCGFLYGAPLGRLLALAARAYLRSDGRVSRPREHPQGRLHHRFEAPVLSLDVLADPARARFRLCPQARADVYSDVRLVFMGRRANRHRPRPRQERASSPGRTRRRRVARRPADFHLSGRHAPAARRAAAIQIRGRLSLRDDGGSLPAGGAQHGPLLGPARLHAAAGRRGDRISAADRAWPRPRPLSRQAAGDGRNRLRPTQRRGGGAGFLARPAAGARSNLTRFLTLSRGPIPSGVADLRFSLTRSCACSIFVPFSQSEFRYASLVGRAWRRRRRLRQARARDAPLGRQPRACGFGG